MENGFWPAAGTSAENWTIALIGGMLISLTSAEARRFYRQALIFIWHRASSFVLACLAILSIWQKPELPFGIVISLMCFVAILRTTEAKSTSAELEKIKTALANSENSRATLADELEKAKLALAAQQEKQSNSIECIKDTVRGRWDKITSVVFGHLPYAPLLEYDAGGGGSPTGLGVDLLKQLLCRSIDGHTIDLQPYEMREDWSTVIENLRARKYDIVATPLFATFRRSKLVSFTTPLFFSNVGLFVSKSYAEYHGLKNLSFDMLLAHLSMVKHDLEFLAIEGEISQILADKHRGERNIHLAATKTMLNSLFARIAKDKSPPLGLFSESFFAHFNEQVRRGEVVNILRAHEILYPVCFAIRHGDYQLFNLLNIRLLEYARDGGALKQLAVYLANSHKITTGEVYQHFVSQWPHSGATANA